MAQFSSLKPDTPAPTLIYWSIIRCIPNGADRCFWLDPDSSYWQFDVLQSKSVKEEDLVCKFLFLLVPDFCYGDLKMNPIHKVLRLSLDF